MGNETLIDPGSFEIKIASTGDVLVVPSGKSILHVLIENGYRVKSDCSNGRCGTCTTRYLEGQPDHKDTALSPEEREEFMTVCVSRSNSTEIVLDLPPPQKTGAYVPDGPVAVVDAPICVACLTCVRACTYDAARIDSELTGVGGIIGAAVIDVMKCTGCGLCAAACPTGAIGMTQFADRDIFSRVDGFFPTAVKAETLRDFDPQIVVFSCSNSAQAVAEFNQDDGPLGRVGLKTVDLPCTGRVDNLFVMKAFEGGADGVIVVGCEPGKCFYSAGNLNATKRVDRARQWLIDTGLDAARVRMVHLVDDDAGRFTEAAHELADGIRAFGPNPLRTNSANKGV